MELFKAFATLVLDTSQFEDKIRGASKTFKSIGSTIKKDVRKIAKVMSTGLVAGASAGATAIGAITKSAIENFAEYEQLAGGAQKIFNQMDYSKIATDANNAYKELGLSANQYLAVINDVGATFAATMGDEAGYEAAKTGLKAISDYASGTGKNVDELSQKFTLITRSTSSYQSIADQFSGILPATSAGFLEQAQAVGILSDKYTQLTEVPIDEYQAAVSQMLQQGVSDLGLANNTMNEAFSTLSGSLSMAKGAWSNLVTGLADDSADLDMLIGNFVESVGAVATQLIPKIGTALNGASKLVRDLIPVIVQEIPVLIEENLPILAEAAISIIQSLVDGISENQEMLMTTAIETITYLAESLITMLPQIVQLGLDLIVSLANGIAESLPELIPTIVDVVLQIVETLTNPDTLGNLMDAALAIIMALSESLLSSGTINKLLKSAVEIINNLVKFLIKNLRPLLNAAIDIIMALVDYILDPSNLSMLVETAIQIVVTIAGALVGAAGELAIAAGKLIMELINKFSETDWKKLGTNVVDAFKRGIQNAWGNLKEWFKGLFGDLIGIAKKILGIDDPSKEFNKIGARSAESFGIGWNDEFSNVAKDIEGSLNFGANDYEVIYDGGSSVGSLRGGTVGGGVTVIQNIYSESKTAADLMQEALYQQERAVLFGV